MAELQEYSNKESVENKTARKAEKLRRKAVQSLMSSSGGQMSSGGCELQADMLVYLQLHVLVS